MRIFRTLLLLAFVLGFTATGQAQFQFGGGGTSTANFNQFGLQAKGQYTVDETWRGAADFNYLFANVGSAWEINLNGHYQLTALEEGPQLYALAGLSVYRYTVNLGTSIFGDLGRVGATDVGLNLGAGANMPLGNLTGYAEAKFAVGGAQFGLAVGVLFGN